MPRLEGNVRARRASRVPRHRYPSGMETGHGAAVVRPARPDDALGIARVHAESWRETYGRFVTDPDTSPWFDAGRRVEMWRSNL